MFFGAAPAVVISHRKKNKQTNNKQTNMTRPARDPCDSQSSTAARPQKKAEGREWVCVCVCVCVCVSPVE